MSNGNIMAMENDTRQWEGSREWQGGESGVHDIPTGMKSNERGIQRYPTKEIEENVTSKVQSHSIGTPTGKSEHRSIGEKFFSRNSIKRKIFQLNFVKFCRCSSHD
jgi:hypothetical protein